MNDKTLTEMLDKTLTDMLEELWDLEHSLSEYEQALCRSVWGDLSIGYASVDDQSRVRQLYRDKVLYRNKEG